MNDLFRNLGKAFHSSAARMQQRHDIEEKGTNLLPKSAYGAAYEFFSPNGGRTFIEGTALNNTPLAFAAYWYVATRWRAQKIAEAPLMVVAEDQVTGNEEWLPKHALVGVLDQPSEDYDMGELIERTSRYLDNTGACVWVVDRDRGLRIARITPFSKAEFKVSSSDTRIYQTFTVQTANGPQDYDASQVCYFHDFAGDNWVNGQQSRLDVAMEWLKLGEDSRRTIRDLLGNAVWPSAVVIPDKEWNPDPNTLLQYQRDLEKYAQQGKRGRPFVQLGGGSFQSLSANIKDLVPTDVLNRVESIIAAVTGVPAVVLQFQIGMENSPWSQMEEARRMAYDDTVSPAWRRFERVITRQLLRTVDDDVTHYIRFDKTNVDSLQRNMVESTQVANAMGRAATLNERRAVMGLEPATVVQDPDFKANLIPELSAFSVSDVLALQNANNSSGNDSSSNDSSSTDSTDPDTSEDAVQKLHSHIAEDERYRALVQRKFTPTALTQMLRNESSDSWEITVHALLIQDRAAIIDIVKTLMVDATYKSLQSKARGKDRVTRAVADYFNREGKARWSKTMAPLMVQDAERAIAVHSADLGVSYALLQSSAIQFAQRNAATMVTEVSKTTKRLIQDIITGGLEENRSTNEIAQLISDATGFDKARARLIARTETTSTWGGAPVQALTAFQESTGRKFLKTWFGVMDNKERDAHVELEGETVGIDEPFSNGLQFPSEPNCRCHILTHEED